MKLKIKIVNLEVDWVSKIGDGDEGGNSSTVTCEFMEVSCVVNLRGVPL